MDAGELARGMLAGAGADELKGMSSSLLLLLGDRRLERGEFRGVPHGLAGVEIAFNADHA